MGDINVRVGRKETGVVVGGYGVEGVNENGQLLADICAERGLFLSNTFFQHKMIHRYTWARGDGCQEPVNYTAVGKRLRREVEDTKAVRRLFCDLGHFAVQVTLGCRA